MGTYASVGCTVAEGQDVDEEPVIDPVTQLPVTDETLAAAIRHGTHYITRRGKPRTVVDWTPNMRRNRHYVEVPKYFGLTEQEVQTYMKICNEALVSIQVIGRVWGKPQLARILEFIRLKKIPIYRWPVGHAPSGYLVFSGDIVRAIESCKLDMDAEGGVWPKYMLRKDRLQRKKKARKRSEQLGREYEANARSSQGNGRAAGQGG